MLPGISACKVITSAWFLLIPAPRYWLLSRKAKCRKSKGDDSSSMDPRVHAASVCTDSSTSWSSDWQGKLTKGLILEF